MTVYTAEQTQKRKYDTGMRKCARGTLGVVSYIGPLFAITIEVTGIETSHDRIPLETNRATALTANFT